MKHLVSALLCACLMVSAPSPSLARGGGALAERVFTAIERQIIDQYYRDHMDDAGHRDRDKPRRGGKSGTLPPGLAKRSSLPPGLAKRERLPPGLARRDLPPDLARRLPPPRDGTQRVIVDANVVLVEIATGVVLDILEGVVRGRRR